MELQGSRMEEEFCHWASVHLIRKAWKYKIRIINECINLVVVCEIALADIVDFNESINTCNCHELSSWIKDNIKSPLVTNLEVKNKYIKFKLLFGYLSWNEILCTFQECTTSFVSRFTNRSILFLVNVAMNLLLGWILKLHNSSSSWGVKEKLNK